MEWNYVSMQMVLSCLCTFASSLTATLENLSVNLSLNSSNSQVAQPNLVVQSARLPAVATEGVQFSAFSGLFIKNVSALKSLCLQNQLILRPKSTRCQQRLNLLK